MITFKDSLSFSFVLYAPLNSVARNQHYIEQLSAIVDDEMQFEAKEPIDGGFATSR